MTKVPSGEGERLGVWCFYGMYRKAGAGPWQVRTPGWPPVCTEVEFFPLTVLRAWALPTSTPPGESGCGA